MKKFVAWLKTRAKSLKKEISALFLAFQRKDTPLLAKIVVGITVCYALSPIDLIPDFIPVLGFLDDVLLLPLLITLAIRLIPKQILDECRNEVETTPQEKQSQRFIYAIPIIIIWLVVIGLIVKAIWF
jgi:uncharacterized membrane protein YkvA (DUF1232 family)